MARFRDYTARVLTGDRPTGNLHLGHYVGSLQNRVAIQESGEYDQFIMIADIQALTDNFKKPKSIVDNICNVFLDYLAAGLDPRKSIIFLQSMIPELHELTTYYMNIVTLGRLQRNPTVKNEIRQKSMGDSLAVGFLCYPVSQAADITAFDAQIVPVGEDQLPMIEQTNEIVRCFNRLYNTDILREVVPQIGRLGRLTGIDGFNKASKSMNNAIFLCEDILTLSSKVNAMYTDPLHINIKDPGRIEQNVVFEYLTAFHPNQELVDEWKAHYQRGGLGDMFLKKELYSVLKDLVEKMDARKRELMHSLDLDHLEENKLREAIFDLLRVGSMKARRYARETLFYVRRAIGMVSY